MLRKETIRRVFTMFSSIMLLLSVVSTLYPAFANAATSDPEVDRKRRFILAAIRCTEKTDVIDTDDDVPGGDVDGMWNDIVREGDSGHRETIIVGFDMNDNGAASCFWLMMKGVEAAQLTMTNGSNVLKADNETKAKELLVRSYTATLPGTSFISGQSYDVVNGGNEISEYLRTALQDKLGSFDHPNDDLRVARFAGGGGKPSLVATCYSFTPEANPGGYDEGRDFKVDGLGTFLLKDDFDHEAVKKLPWIEYNDSAVQLDITPRASIGDVELDFTLADATVGAGWDSQGSDFFPIGSDINQTDGMDNGVVDCNFARVQKDWLFANRDKWKVDGNELTYEGTSLTESASTVLASNPPDGGASDDGQATCEASGNQLSWILCPIFNGLAELTDWIYRTLIQPFLYSPPVSTDPNSESFKVWSSFRVVGNIILVIGLLVIIFGQSLGGGLIDAYTAKKVFPRIIAAAILTNLSVYLVAVAVDVSNIMGTGIAQLMFAPFKASGMANFELSGTQAAVGAGTPLAFMGVMTASFIAGGGTIATIGSALVGVFPVLMLFIIVPAVLILLAIFIVLALRRALIVFLVMIAPVAFALYVLPNTEKYFKKWWEFLVKALMVYPIVTALFALADIMAITMLTASNPNNSNFAENGIALLIAFALQLIPLAAIPFAFKMAGGILGNIYGTLAGMGKKGSELLKGQANDPLSMRNRARFKARSALNDANLSGTALGTHINPFMGGRKRRARLTSIRDTNQALLGTDVAGAALFKEASNDDKVMHSLAKYGSSRKAYEATNKKFDDKREAINKDSSLSSSDKAQMLAAVENDRAQHLAATATADRIGRTSANRRMALMQGSTLKYGLPAGEEGWNEGMRIIDDIANGDETQKRSMINSFQYMAKQAGRADLSGATDSDIYDGDRAWKSVGLYQQANGHSNSIKGSGIYYRDKIKSGTESDLDDAAVFYKELEALIPNSVGGVRDEAVKQMEALEADKSFMDHLNKVEDTVQVAKRDPKDPNNWVYENVNVTRGQMLSAGKIAGKRVRAYERPDPNRLAEG